MTTRPPLRRIDLANDPLDQLRRWVESGSAEPSMRWVATLCTVDAAGFPRARLVPLRGLDERGALVQTSLESAKGSDLIERPDAVDLLFGWAEELRQIRVDGRAEVLADSDAERAFAERPRAAQLRAWMTVGTGSVADRAELEARREDIAHRFSAGEVPRPPWWAIVRVVPRRVEVFQGATDGCHDRFLYEPAGTGWHVTRLVP